MQKGKLAALFAGAGLMLLARGAQATAFSIDAAAIGGGSGSYHVNLTQTGNDWHVDSVHANSGGNTPTSDGFTVRLYFLDGSGNFISNITGSSTGGVDGGGTNWGPFSVINPSGSTWYAQWFNILNPTNNLLANGTNTFVEDGGSVTVGTPVAQVVAEVLGPNGTFESTVSFTPEADSLAMLLPGLLPLGMVLRRRRASRS